MTYRIIDDGTYSEPVQQALEGVLVERLDEGDLEPTLRFWYRESPAVALGRFQAYEDEVAVDYADQRDIDVVRRLTGGGAMYVEPGAVITYSLYLPREAVSADIEASYAELDQWAIDALGSIGLEVSHEPLNDITHPDGKIGGSAQLRKDDAVVHHTTMSYALDTSEMLRVLRIGEEKVSDKAIESAEKRVAVMRDYVDASREEIIAALKDTFAERFDAEPGSVPNEVIGEARTRASETFATEEWNRKL
ncbi:lipoate--protein ligase [Natrinema saccharevitans]|uniref:Lipoate--protein ligase n=1 Tax=Natrinema saccharevitans TaxID=301967 RepID=A0A1S8ARR5_9EURY|nr:biotin/lipoate A/B protein ligase family protein [Natrinema saccharevitans]OLZ39219.1 lipoate--protein ligase [Natrinema saccharevitans]